MTKKRIALFIQFFRNLNPFALGFLPLWFILLILFIPLPILGITIEKVKGKKITIQTEGTSVSKGEFYFIQDSAKKKGLLKIMKIKGKKALGKLMKGKAEPGWTLSLKETKTNHKNSSGLQKSSDEISKEEDSVTSGGPPAQQKDLFLGGLVGYGMTTMDVMGIGTQSKDVNLTGSSLSFHFMADYKLTDLIGLRGLVGYESLSFSYSGSNICGANNDAPNCFTDLSFMSLGLLGRFSVFYTSDMVFWLGGGSSLFFPLSTNSNAISNISTLFILTVSLGVDIFIDSTMKIPLQLNYNLIPPTETVSNTSFISGQLGLSLSY